MLNCWISRFQAVDPFEKIPGEDNVPPLMTKYWEEGEATMPLPLLLCSVIQLAPAWDEKTALGRFFHVQMNLGRSAKCPT